MTATRMLERQVDEIERSVREKQRQHRHSCDQDDCCEHRDEFESPNAVESARGTAHPGLRVEPGMRRFTDELANAPALGARQG